MGTCDRLMRRLAQARHFLSAKSHGFAPLSHGQVDVLTVDSGHIDKGAERPQ